MLLYRFPIAGSCFAVLISAFVSSLSAQTLSDVSVTPSSGSGSSQTFTAVYSDSSGASQLNRKLLLINSSLNGSNACYIQVDSAGFHVVNDAGNALGSSSSQCSLNAGSTNSASGTQYNVTANIAFQPSFAGPKTIFMYTEDFSGNNTGWQTRGSYTVTGAGANPISLSPLNGSGTSATFTATYSDSAGAGFLNRRLLLFNSSLASANGCFVQADPTGIYLANDAGNALIGPLSNSSLSNSQCTVAAAGTSLSNSGNTSTLTAAITFTTSFGGTKNVYMYAEDNTGSSGWQTFGTYGVPFAGGPPTIEGVGIGGSGQSTISFSANYREPAGTMYLNRRLFLVNSTLNGAGACFVQADNSGIYLVNDAGNGLIGPFNSAAISNSQCALDSASLNNSGDSGRLSTLSITLTFGGSFAGSKNIYVYADDTASQNTGWQSGGAYTVPGTSISADSVTPASGSGSSQTFTAIYSDPGGASAFKRRLFIINAALNGSSSCFVQTDSTGIYLVADNGSTLLGPVSNGNSQTNSQCTLNGSGSAVNNSGNMSSVTLPIVFKAPFAGAKNIYMYAEDSSSNTGWQTKGTWTSQ